MTSHMCVSLRPVNSQERLGFSRYLLILDGVFIGWVVGWIDGWMDRLAGKGMARRTSGQING